MALETNAGSYPAVYFAVSEDNKIANWRPLAHMFMAIPHFIVMYLVMIGVFFVQVISWFAILFTGKLSPGMANFMIMGQRYQARVTGFLYGLTEVYPPFEFESTAADPGNYPIRLDITPQLEGRNRLTVFFRNFMLIPLWIFLMIVGIGAYFTTLIAWFAVLFTGTYPVGLRDFFIKVMRLSMRVGAYGSLLTDDYPPFALE